MKDFKDTDMDPKLLAILNQKDQPLDGDAFTRHLMQRVEAEEALTEVETRVSWFRPAALGTAAVAAIAMAAPSLADVGTTLLRITPDSYMELGQFLGVSAVAAGALLLGLAPVANTLGEALAERR